jgi:hypothetical protein
VKNHVIDVLALGRETETARVQPFAEFLVQFFLDCAHRKTKIDVEPALVKI